ncbi:3-oxoadipate enol-lactonase / 4-carboxymuconolactone decarboxylase [Roseomonas rosea]|uniref:3-oxoadipate enol-lactonase / 4-carboxymuconolactone decarboxylase n=1 Tax=Muricoccus roseus TaxID=198092 RepID=A0A1M6KU15_9PROT|nr:4-carboxymuconolactone decarboxylase [Roseomonas rosea]SHJ62382.1 3-oxoadipate enol-lactonase / 4-carboxymuconolactone decarboxylase [Roseomonas rosea]
MFIAIRDMSVHVQVQGPPGAPPVLMMHSLGTGLHVWDPQADILSRTHRVIRFDLRGHGLTGVVPGEATMADLAEDAFAVMDALGIPAAHLAGISIGGRIAMEMAAAQPGRVLSLFLLDTALEFPPPSNWQARIEAVGAGGMAAVVDGVMARWVVDQSSPSSRALRSMLLTTPAQGYAAACAALRDARAAPLQGRLQCRARVVVGELDQASPVSAAAAIQEAIPGSTLTVLPGVSHIPTFEAAEAITEALQEHLASPPVGDAHAAGMAVRKAVLGEAHVARAQANVTALDAPFQDYITRNVWGQIWTRPGLPRHTRSLLTLAVTAALAREGEFGLHVRATRNTGVTPEEIAEVLLQVGAYAGVPVANHALKIAKDILAQMEDAR